MAQLLALERVYHSMVYIVDEDLDACEENCLSEVAAEASDYLYSTTTSMRPQGARYANRPATPLSRTPTNAMAVADYRRLSRIPSISVQILLLVWAKTLAALSERVILRMALGRQSKSNIRSWSPTLYHSSPCVSPTLFVLINCHAGLYDAGRSLLEEQAQARLGFVYSLLTGHSLAGTTTMPHCPCSSILFLKVMWIIPRLTVVGMMHKAFRAVHPAKVNWSSLMI
jgi:hypothetical protein